MQYFAVPDHNSTCPKDSFIDSRHQDDKKSFHLTPYKSETYF